MSRKEYDVHPGDLFEKVGYDGVVWEVERLLEFHDLPPHLRLSTRTEPRKLTFAVSAVLDHRLFRPLGRNGHGDGHAGGAH